MKPDELFDLWYASAIDGMESKPSAECQQWLREAFLAGWEECDAVLGAEEARRTWILAQLARKAIRRPGSITFEQFQESLRRLGVRANPLRKEAAAAGVSSGAPPMATAPREGAHHDPRS